MNYIEVTISKLHKIIINDLKEEEGVNAEMALATFGGIMGIHLAKDIIKKI